MNIRFVNYFKITYRFLRLVLTFFAGRPSSRVKLLIQIMRKAQEARHDGVARLSSRMLQKYGLYISNGAKIGEGFKLPHPVAVVIGRGVVIGSNVTIYQCVTLGGRNQGDWQLGNHPEVCDGATLFAGAVVLGKVRIGNRCVIGANSVVLNDIPDDCVAVGAPARILNTFK